MPLPVIDCFLFQSNLTILIAQLIREFSEFNQKSSSPEDDTTIRFYAHTLRSDCLLAKRSGC
ncbi:hypothetical protein GmarT_11570 [Gimesia maris]|jgi:hypothetical protein|uniref:Uncharacterized protein n=1 Tax=Gimesia maris TaxID=122 RepID=A0ABX5YHX6_9PLAN|nr:hypothetical protein Mal35_11550 [Gimesia maris]QDU13390.1 hypothetical protein CA11_11730 [Gimesia maris]QEG15317.1 hypothetical protein GmarT_11570 [Gimesia maris]